MRWIIIRGMAASMRMASHKSSQRVSYALCVKDLMCMARDIKISLIKMFYIFKHDMRALVIKYLYANSTLQSG